MNVQLKMLLDHLLATLDEKRQVEIEDLHQRALNWEPVERLPLILSYPGNADFPFQPYPVSLIYNDPEKMLYNELVHAFDTSIACHGRLADDLPCTVRGNFGTVLIASMFGATVQQVDENPPWVVHSESHDISPQAIVAQDPCDFKRGWLPRMIATYEAYRQILSAYPALQKIIKIVLPDLQGPFDNLELLVGSAVFADLAVNETLAARALHTLAIAQVTVVRHVSSLINDGPAGFAHQHAAVIKGQILLRNDSVIMVSPEMYRDQIAAHDEYVLQTMQGGGIHSCGKINAHAASLLEVPGIQCLDLGQPELNDLDCIYKLAKAKRIPLVRVSVPKEELMSARVMDRFPTGVTLRYKAACLAEAKQIMNAYQQAASKRKKREANASAGRHAAH